MNVSLTPELEDLVQRKVRSGHYTSASEVVREGLRLLMERDEVRDARLGALQRDINVGIEQADAGQLIPGSQVFERLRSRHKKAHTRR